MKNKLKKSLLATAVIGASLSSINSYAGGWCGYPVCPGDLVYDATQSLKRQAKYALENDFFNNQIMPFLEEKMEKSFDLSGMMMSNDLKREMADVSKITDTKTALYNKKQLLDLQPVPDEACKMLIAKKYLDTKSKEKSIDIVSKGYSKTASRAIRNKSTDPTEISIRQYEKLLNLKNSNNKSILDIDTMYTQDTLDAASAKTALLGIDVLVNTEKRIQPSLSQENEVKGEESNAYKVEFVDNARKALTLNFIKYHLSEPIFDRLGIGNASSSLEEEKKKQEDLRNKTDDANFNEIDLENKDEKNNHLNKTIEDLSDNAKDTSKDNENENESDKDDKKDDNLKTTVFNDFDSYPVNYVRVSSNFGYRIHPTQNVGKGHGGIDLAAPKGEVVVAGADGRVSIAHILNGYGKVVYIEHDNNIETRYAHLSKILVSIGDTVKKGDKIGLVGSTGESTGNHLHYEIRQNGIPYDPAHIVGKSGNEVGSYLASAYSGDIRFGKNNKSLGSNAADNSTLSSQSLRKELMIEGLSFQNAMKKYKNLEKLKFILALKSLDKLSKQ